CRAASAIEPAPAAVVHDAAIRVQLGARLRPTSAHVRDAASAARRRRSARAAVEHGAASVGDRSAVLAERCARRGGAPALTRYFGPTASRGRLAVRAA